MHFTNVFMCGFRDAPGRTSGDVLTVLMCCIVWDVAACMTVAGGVPIMAKGQGAVSGPITIVNHGIDKRPLGGSNSRVMCIGIDLD